MSRRDPVGRPSADDRPFVRSHSGKTPVAMSFMVAGLQRAYSAAAIPDEIAFQRALCDPESAQQDVLRRIIASNRRSQFGDSYAFASMKGYSDFAERVPVADYEAYASDIERIARGDARVLTEEEVTFLEPTGGSSGPSKLIPYTRSLKRQLSRALSPWTRDLFVNRPWLRRGRAYWAISPPARLSRTTTGGIPIGAPHDADYFPKPVARFVNRMLVPPRATAEIEDLEACRYVTLRALLAADDLTLISVWNPSFLTLLAEYLDEVFDLLLYDLERGTLSIPLDERLRPRLESQLTARPRRAGELRRRYADRPPKDLAELWPRLRMISCWTDGHAERSLAKMKQRFPEVEIQGKGLLATEGIVSLPLTGFPAPVAALTSHFLEFIPVSGGSPLLAHELDERSAYEVVITTGGGLYRYRLKDIVRVEGRVERTPLLRFVGRADAASDLCGEKLTPGLVESALREASRATGVHPMFALVSPRWDTAPRYDLWLELPPEVASPAAAARSFAGAVEAHLRLAHHYDLCRRLGQLDELTAHLIPGAERIYERGCIDRGQRAGATKPPVLDPELGWERRFEKVSA